MFEKANSIIPLAQSRPEGRAGQDARAREGVARSEAGDRPARGGEALRAIDWSELNARLGAARDLRLLLRRDADRNIEANAASFGDAAARYFAALGQGERPVNPDDLEARKASGGILRASEGDAATGDARDD
ncbi:hypothetical protein [Erythrobacter sp.]|uniref:hypothetical protein n=1 Tax=Erythrobacter sp. TaxID=1042 RepID=UPI001425F36B|nr:hypothetical protein [Erythrobacter sp.]QIQ87566.1 MAG: hypothetical protein G9473_13385 [Erythrobacter sp.]